MEAEEVRGQNKANEGGKEVAGLSFGSKISSERICLPGFLSSNSNPRVFFDSSVHIYACVSQVFS